MASVGPNSPASGVNTDNSGGTAWTNPGNVLASDNSYATCSMGTVHPSDFIDATNFGFAIPTNATILGILLEVERKEDTAGDNIVDNSIRLLKAGAAAGSDKASASEWPTSDAYASYGSGSDLWGTTWTPGDVNASNFGARVAAETAVGGTGSVDHIRITVTYAPLPIVPICMTQYRSRRA